VCLAAGCSGPELADAYFVVLLIRANSRRRRDLLFVSVLLLKRRSRVFNPQRRRARDPTGLDAIAVSSRYAGSD
jgi:hypothetical protein